MGEFDSTAPSSQTITCEQAIYTSLRSGTGQGYRIVAASPGLTSAERADITRRSPSHDGLCETCAEADGLAYYPLTGGRWCLAHSCAAGIEHTGRGGYRVYTRALIIASEDRVAFDHDPLAMLTASHDAGMAEVELEPPSELPVITLEPALALRPPADVADCWRKWGPPLVDALDILMHGEQLVLITKDDPVDCMWALTASLPAAVRAVTSVSCNLKFSLGRCLSLNIVADDAARIRRLLRGHRINCIEVNADQESPIRNIGGWAQMMALQWARGEISELLDLTGQATTHGSAADFDAVAEFNAEADSVEHKSPAELVDLLRRLHDGPASCSLGTELGHCIRTKVADRLTNLAQAMSPSAAWTLVADLADAYLQGWGPRAPLASGLLACLERVVERQPADVVRFVVGLLESAVGGKANVLPPLDDGLQALLRRIAVVLTPTNLNEALALGALMGRWHMFLPHHEVAEHLSRKWGAIPRRTARM